MKSSVILTRRRPIAAAQPEPRSKRRYADQRRRAPKSKPPTPERLMQIAWGYAPPLILEAALNCRVFDLLDQGPRTVGELATQSGAAERGVTAILYALVGLEFLVLNQGRVVNREEIAEHVWDESFDPFSNVIDVYIKRLRAKLEKPEGRRLIHTRRGEGYVLRAGEEPGDD